MALDHVGDDRTLKMNIDAALAEIE
jgi:hypothetical protein